jgi:hypothetical protein
MTQPIRSLPTTLAGLLSDSTAALAVFQSLTNVRQINAPGYMGELQLQDQNGQAFLPASLHQQAAMRSKGPCFERPSNCRLCSPVGRVP